MEKLTEKTDEQLMAGIAAGDTSLLGELYIRYNRAIQGALYHWAPEFTQADIEDVTQEIFIAIGKSVANYKEQSRFKAWMFELALRTLTNWRRKFWVRSRFLKRHKTPVAMGTPVDTCAPTSRMALRQAIGQMMARLPDDQRQTVWLHFVEGFGGDEIAAMMHVRRATVYTRLHRARQTLASSVQASAWKSLLTEDE